MSRETSARVRVVLESLRRMGVPELRGLTDAEIALHASRPSQIPVVSNDMAVAWAVARGGFHAAQLHNGRGDAFRHAFWAAMLARDVGFHNAQQYTREHENWEGSPPAERAMDSHNNRIGALIGAHGHLLGSHGIVRRRGLSDGALAIACYLALRNGRLRVIRGDRLLPSS